MIANSASAVTDYVERDEIVLKVGGTWDSAW